jgi:hypothetical protein
MATVDWLPRSTDTRVILATAYNEFFKNAEIAVIPSDGELDRPYEPLPPSVNAFGTLKIASITPELARSIHTIIHAPKRAFSWGPSTAGTSGQTSSLSASTSPATRASRRKA